MLFIDECYRLSGRGAQDFGPEAIDELMSAMETGNPVMIFAGYNDSAMDEFVASNPGLFRRISSVFVFEAYLTAELAKILLLKIEGSGFKLDFGNIESPLEVVTGSCEFHSPNLEFQRRYSTQLRPQLTTEISL